MKKILFLLIFSTLIFSQTKNDKESEESLQKPLGINDRAGGTHNASNIGLFFENRGKLYPRRISQGPSGEFPINSGMHYIYRMNPMVGIPGNVIQGRYTTNEEWEAAYGYHNRDSAKIAFSDDPSTWHPTNGWPVKDSAGNPIFFSDQDSYAVYNDSGNTISILGIEVHQKGYAYGVTFAKNILFFQYDVINKSNNIYNDLYFNLYMDCDVGNISGGVPEYGDDKVGFAKDKNLVYFHDDGVSSEWPDGKTGLMGMVFLSSPQQKGITDFHYNLYEDDLDIDSVQYGIMSSSSSLFNSSLGAKYFHLGSNTALNFDDPATIPAAGIDLLANISSGPYTLAPNDTLKFITAIVAGSDFSELLEAAQSAQNTVNANFELPKPPSRPKLYGDEDNNKVILYWDDMAERSIDKFSGELDFEGYRIYRSNDKGINWTRIADFDINNSIGENSGLQYSYVDSGLTNGFEYWYSITAYDRGSSNLESLESPIGNTLESSNTISLTPRSNAIGRSPVQAADVNHINGLSNYVLNVNPADNQSLAGSSYKISFLYQSRKDAGDLNTSVSIDINDTSKTKPYSYLISFTSSNAFDLINITTGETIRIGYPYPSGGRPVAIPSDGITIHLTDAPGTPANLRPEAGDKITVNYSVKVVKNNSEEIVSGRPFTTEQIHSTEDGVIFSLVPPEIIQSVSRIGGNDDITLTFNVDDELLVKENLYIINVEGNGINAQGKSFVSLSVRDSGLVANFDTLYTLEYFSFDGIEGRIQFNQNSPPSAGNKFSVKTVKPQPPGISDIYTFTIEGAEVSASQISAELEKIKVVPNPYIVSSLFEPEFGELRREPLRRIQFINLPPECSIYIFTVDGDMVKRIEHNSDNGTENWDLRTESGREIAPGIYVYVVKTQQTEFVNRFAVIK